MTRWMFDASSNFFKEFTRINDFTQVCAASVWTMRWQVKGFFAEAGYYETPSVRPMESDLDARFLAGSGLHSANFRSLVDGQTWQEQSSILTEMLLLTIVSLFEGWTEAIGIEIGLSKQNRDALQWPSYAKYPRYNRAGNPVPGTGEALQAERSRSSVVMSTCFYPTCKSNRHYRLAQIDELMICYRYWKEIRNALAHTGGMATSRVVTEESNLASITPAAIGMSHVPRAQIRGLNQPVSIDLRTVNGFGEALYNIVATVDAELSQTEKAEKAEKVMIEHWESLRRSHKYHSPPMAAPRREIRIQNWMIRAGLPTPVNLATLDTFLTERYGIDLRVP